MIKDKLQGYLSLMRKFNSSEIGADEFEKEYLRMFKNDDQPFSSVVFNILNDLFGDVDAFVPEGLNIDDDSINGEQLLAKSRLAYEKLVAAVGNIYK